MKHRPDIDGLRALAVVPVILFHIGLPAFSGGFVGVDVFFVISGFLITSMITEDLRQGRFSLADFYERRIRRIFPALFTVLLGTALLASIVLLPRDFASFGKSLVATALFGSNIFFWRQAGYFDLESHTKPLLHTWSLSVEEQFYLAFPLLLLLIHRWMPRQQTRGIIALAVLSLGISIWGVARYPEAAFYLAPTRAWELLLGALLAVGVFPAPERQGTRELAAGLGILLLASSFYTLSIATPFPGLNALQPCIGTALIISAGTQGTTWVGRLLTVRPIVFIGLISYSLYLWHWPLISLIRNWTLEPLTFPQAVTVIALSVAAASLSWQFVEKPLRRRGSAVTRRATVFAWAGAVSVVAIVFGNLTYRSGGWPGRVGPDVLALDAAQRDFSPSRATCHANNAKRIGYGQACIYGAKGVKPRFAVWGDSHATELGPMLGEVAAGIQGSVRLVSYTSCPPALSFRQRKLLQCARHNAEVLRDMRADPELDVVFLVARYSGAFTARGNSFLEGFTAIATSLAESGKQVVIVYPRPEYRYSVPVKLARSAQHGDDLKRVGMSRADFESQQGRFVALLNGITGPGKIFRIDPTQRLCDASFCQAYADSAPLYFDEHHLSVAGARYLAPLFEPFVRPREARTIAVEAGSEPRGRRLGAGVSPVGLLRR